LLTGVIIFVVGLYLANLAITTIKSSGIENANKLAAGARVEGSFLWFSCCFFSTGCN
jgi:hypothetical protein